MIKAIITYYYKGVVGDIYEKAIDAAYFEAQSLNSPRIQDVVMVRFSM